MGGRPRWAGCLGWVGLLAMVDAHQRLSNPLLDCQALGPFVVEGILNRIAHVSVLCVEINKRSRQFGSRLQIRFVGVLRCGHVALLGLLDRAALSMGINVRAIK